MSGLVLDVFVDTPTGNQRGPPSTSFPCAEQLHPFGVRLRSARSAHLRSASPQRGEAGGKKDKLQKQVYTGGELPPRLRNPTMLLPSDFMETATIAPHQIGASVTEQSSVDLKLVGADASIPQLPRP